MVLVAAIITIGVSAGAVARRPCAGPMPGPPKRSPPDAGALFVVANRGGGSVSLVDPAAAEVVDTYALPDGGEPM
ncbi:hypothetical protein MMPV_007934 [Pyropia vietnamensis]